MSKYELLDSILNALPEKYRNGPLVVNGDVMFKVYDGEMTAKEAAEIVIRDTDERFKHQRELLKIDKKQEEKQLTFGDFEE